MSDYPEFENKMKKTCDALEAQFATIRAGRANAAVLDQITVDYYGSPIENATKRLFVDAKKCGYYVPNKRQIRKVVEFLERNPKEMERLKENIKFFDKTKNGAEQIADDLYENVCGMKK